MNNLILVVSEVFGGVLINFVFACMLRLLLLSDCKNYKFLKS